jgi:indolepyruvate ferredoxin oxidoreductase
MAPPFLAKSRHGQPPTKVRLGAWMLPAMRWLARGRRLRGTVLDLFGRTEERRMERQLIGQYEARIGELLDLLAPDTLKLATEIAALPLSMRGFGHVKIANVALARAREAELLHRLDPQRWPRPPSTGAAGQIRGIAVVAG